MSDMDRVVAQTVAVLNAGGIILYPTDTIWGLGCDATNEQAVRRIFELKRRSDSKSLILLVENPDSFQKYTHTDIQKYRALLIENSSPQTVIIPQAVGLAKGVVPIENTAAVRCPKHIFCQTLLKSFKKPLVSTSANISGEPAPVQLKDISELIRKNVDFVVPEVYDKGAAREASRIVMLDETGQLKRLR